jgi:hypothetical protein
MKLLGRGAHAAQFSDGDEVAEVAEFHEAIIKQARVSVRFSLFC